MEARGEEPRRIRSLDGLRAVAITLVILSHVAFVLGAKAAHPALLRLEAVGILGVRVFFVLSGFLITDLLLQEKAATGRIDLRRFYLRRTLRIFPAYYVFLAAMAAAAACGLADAGGRTGFLHAFTYTFNYV